MSAVSAASVADGALGALLLFCTLACSFACARPSLALLIALGRSESVGTLGGPCARFDFVDASALSERALPEGSDEGTEGDLPFAACA